MLLKYTVLPNDAFPGRGGVGPDSPDDAIQAATLEDARRSFRKWLSDSGNDYQRADGFGAPFADVVLTSSWDGISYGDIIGGSGICRFERGPRGGIVREGY